MMNYWSHHAEPEIAEVKHLQFAMVSVFTEHFHILLRLL